MMHLDRAAMLGKLLSIPKAQTDKYTKEAQTMRTNIDKFFGATVEGV